VHWIALLPLPHAEALPTGAVTPTLPGGRAGVGPGFAGTVQTASKSDVGRCPGQAAALIGGQTAGLDADLRLWSWRALQFTPRVALADGVVVLEISASERLFGGRRALLRRIFEQNQPHPIVEWSQGATSLVAIGRLLERLQARQHGAPGPAATPPAQLPLAALAAARAHLPTLQRLGCRSWGDLRALPRGGLVRRFGNHLLDALDQAFGEKPELYPWLTLPEVFDEPLELPAHVESASALLFGARRLLALLHTWLQARQRGALVLRLGWQMDRRRNVTEHDHLLVCTAEPTLDMAHFERLLAEHLARITLAAPAIALRLATVETAPLPGASASLLLEDRRQGDSLHQLVERLSARLGAAQVQRVEPRADHRPERMQAWSAAVDAPQLIAKNDPATLGRGPKSLKTSRKKPPPAPAAEVGAPKACAAPAVAASATLQPDALYPTWLLAAPQRLKVQRHRPLYQGPLTLLAGPQRIESGWWEPDASGTAAAPAALRDYFVARSAQAGLLWIYRERLAPSDAQPGWFLHGLFA
jgi:protein ImuB